MVRWFRSPSFSRWASSGAISASAFRCAACRFCYSIEPMCPEPSREFYKKFILVREGQKVRKGDVIAYLYTPPSSGDGCHIHFHLMIDGRKGFLAPAIFTAGVVKAFHKQCRAFKESNDGRPIAGRVPLTAIGIKPGEEPPRPGHVVLVPLAEALDQHFLLLGRPRGEQGEDGQAAQAEEPIGRQQRPGGHEQRRRHVEGVPDPAVGAVRHQGRARPGGHGVREVLAQAGERPVHQGRATRPRNGRGPPDPHRVAYSRDAACGSGGWRNLKDRTFQKP